MEIIQHLVDEHNDVARLIWNLDQLLERSPASWDSAFLELLMKFIPTFVEHLHHGKEEDILFPLLANHPALNQGGPQCTFFMGIKLNRDPVNPIFDVMGKPPLHHPKPAIDEILKNQSPLRIPIEEHQAGAAAIHFLKSRLQQNLVDETFARMLQNYRQLLQSHMDKENKCLFILATEALPLNVRKQAYDQVREFEKSLPMEIVHEGLKALKN